MKIDLAAEQMRPAQSQNPGCCCEGRLTFRYFPVLVKGVEHVFVVAESEVVETDKLSRGSSHGRL